jgi:hypothetical protein
VSGLRENLTSRSTGGGGNALVKAGGAPPLYPTSHVRFGGRAGETDRSKDQHRAPARPNTLALLAYAFLVATRTKAGTGESAKGDAAA